MMNKHLHINIPAESIVDLIMSTAHKASELSIEDEFLTEAEYHEIIHASVQDAPHKIKAHLHGTVECKFLDIQRLIETYFKAREMDAKALEALDYKRRG